MEISPIDFGVLESKRPGTIKQKYIREFWTGK